MLRVHLIDGTYELFRAHYGVARHLTDLPFPAASGLVRGLIRLMRQASATHVACAFDNPIESFRNQLFPAYKSSEGVEPVLLAQFDLAERVSRALGIVTWPMAEFEADDALACATARITQQLAASSSSTDPAVQVVLCSPDKDLMQCVLADQVVCWDSLRSKVYDEPAVVEKFGVAPRLIPDLLALVGDAADGLPGVPGWGWQTAAQALRRFPSLEAIALDASAWSEPPRGLAARLRALAEHQSVAVLYKRLATLRTDVPLSETLEDLRYRGPDPELAAALVSELADPEASKLISELGRQEPGT
jgi:5'-3' exonuclease